MSAKAKQQQDDFSASIFSRVTKQANVVWKLMELQIRTIFKQPMLIFTIFFLPLIVLFGVGTLIPIYDTITVSFSLALTLITGMMFGSLYYNLESTTFKHNASLANIGVKTKLTSISFTTLGIVLISAISTLIVIIILDVNELVFLDAFVFFGSDHYQALDIKWLSIQWANFAYYVILNIILSITLYQFIRIFFNNEKTFSMFVLVYFIFSLVFGGVLTTNYTANETWASDDILMYNDRVLMGKQESAWEFDRWLDYSVFFTPTYFLNGQFTTLFKVGASQANGLYGWEDGVYFFNPDGIAIADLPSWAQGIQTEIDAVKAVTAPENLNEALLNDPALVKTFWDHNKALNPNTSYWRWNDDYSLILTIFLPYVYMIIFILIGSSVDKKSA